MRISVHEALARVRRRSRFSSLDSLQDEETRGDQRTPESAAHQHELGGAVQAAVDALPTAFRAVFVLRLVEGLTVAETAAATGLEQATVKTRLRRARAQLQAALAEHEDAARHVYRFAGERRHRIVARVLARIGAGTGRGPDG